jgi:pyrimidine-nucleoside phosphorylase
VEILKTIAAKRDGEELATDELRELILGYAREEVEDCQMAAFLMAGYLQGFSIGETSTLTTAMLDSGERLDLRTLSGPTVDKHSTGGVSDGTTLVVAPLVAELGMQIVKLSGRGLGHSGGTLDKLESIPGLRTQLSRKEMLEQVEEVGLVVCAQSAELVPADRAMYALRDATATVGSIPLIASSVMSKKLAGGARTILLDVKAGSGAFMKEIEQARELAAVCVQLGENASRTTGAVISDMSQPLGEMIGNAIEVREAIEVLRGERENRLLELSLELVSHLSVLCGLTGDLEQGRKAAERALSSGAGLERFRRFVAAQGGNPDVVEDLSLLPAPALTREVRADREGWLAGTDAEAIGLAAARLGAGRERKNEDIDPAVGIALERKLGARVERGSMIARIFARDESSAEQAEQRVLESLTFSEQETQPPQLLLDVIGPSAGKGTRSGPGPPRGA